MKYQVLDRFKAITSQGEMELQPGQIITMPHNLAIRLLNEGKITPIEKAAYKVYSEVLHTHLWVCETTQDMHTLRAKGIKEAIYSQAETKKLKGVDAEDLKAVHEVKTVFKDSKIEECKKNEE